MTCDEDELCNQMSVKLCMRIQHFSQTYTQYWFVQEEHITIIHFFYIVPVRKRIQMTTKCKKHRLRSIKIL